MLVARSDILYNSSTYPALFNKYGGIFGGNGTTTFALPERRGRSLRGADLGSGNDPDHASRTGGLGASKIGSYQNDDFKSHNHTTKHAANGWSDYISQGSNSFTNGGGGVIWTASSFVYGNTITPTGGLETRTKNISVLACVVALSIL